MSDNKKRPAADLTGASFMPGPPSGQVAGKPDANSGAGASDLSATGNRDLTAELKRRIEETRLPSKLKERILAELPPPEERERLLRELQEMGGLSSEQFLTSLGLEVERQP
jgi:hypothetical protein